MLRDTNILSQVNILQDVHLLNTIQHNNITVLQHEYAHPTKELPSL